MHFTASFSLCLVLVAAKFNPLHHLGGNSPWFAGPTPSINNTCPSTAGYSVPDQCVVDQAVYVVRHGSRYPDPSAYNGWVALQKKFQNATFTASGSLSFIKNWKPVLDNPAAELSQESVGGYLELAKLGGELRYRYPGFYEYGNPFHLWANQYPAAPRVVDSARSPNATTLGTIYVINSTAPLSVGNSLGTSDSCPKFLDSSGGTNATTWNNVYLPPITQRLNGLIRGNLTLATTDVSMFPYLCGFETQITGHSPWCDVFEDNEILDYEYAQDIRYYYGEGLGAGNNDSVQYPLLQGIVNLLQTGPNRGYANVTNGTVPPPLVMAFTNDGQINELASIIGVFSQQKPLTATARLPDSERLYRSSRVVPMRGTVAFERLNCGGEPSVRLRLNDAVYTVPDCTGAPGNSCPLDSYADLVAENFSKAGSFAQVCNVSTTSVVRTTNGGVTFFNDVNRPGIYTVQP